MPKTITHRKTYRGQFIKKGEGKKAKTETTEPCITDRCILQGDRIIHRPMHSGCITICACMWAWIVGGGHMHRRLTWACKCSTDWDRPKRDGHSDRKTWTGKNLLYSLTCSRRKDSFNLLRPIVLLHLSADDRFKWLLQRLPLIIA